MVTSQNIAYNSAATAPAAPAKTGSAFAGWYSDAGLTAGFAFATPITADTTLYAKWTVNSYIVTFNSNGGSVVTSQNVAFNSAATAPPAPTKIGSAFAGWYSDAGLTAVFAFAAPITADTTLYAKWTVNSYTVTFNSNGGSVITSQNIAYNSTAVAPAAPTKTGYTFAGWLSDASLTTTFAFTTAITADTTLYAKWTVSTYTISFTVGANGSLTGTASQTVNYSGNASQVAAVPNTGYHFDNWTGTGGFVTSATNPLTVASVMASQAITANFTIIDGILIPAPGKTRPDIADALRVLNIATGKITSIANDYIHADIAPLAGINVPKGDGVIDIYDVIGIMRMIVGLL